MANKNKITHLIYSAGLQFSLADNWLIGLGYNHNNVLKARLQPDPVSGNEYKGFVPGIGGDYSFHEHTYKEDGELVPQS